MTLLQKYESWWIPEPNTGCYIWLGYFSRNPTLTIKYKKINVARVVCEEINGPPPTSEHQAAHNTPNGCIGRFCVNGNHLRWATQSENERDKPNSYDLPEYVTLLKGRSGFPYKVQIGRKYVGTYRTLEDAVAAIARAV